MNVLSHTALILIENINTLDFENYGSKVSL